MHKFFTSKAISVLSILISLAAIVLSIMALIENEFSFEEVKSGIIVISLLLFGLIGITQKISSFRIPINNIVEIWILLILCLIVLLYVIIFSFEEEEFLSLLIFSPLLIVTLHHYYLSKTPIEEIGTVQFNLWNKVVVFVKGLDYFKLFIVVAIVFYLIIQHEKSKNGRYMSYDNQNEIIDTRTGFVYEIETDYVGGVRLYEPQLPEY